MSGHKLFWTGVLLAICIILIGIFWNYIEEAFWYIYNNPIILFYIYAGYSIIATVIISWFSEDNPPPWAIALFIPSILGIIIAIIAGIIYVSVDGTKFIIKQIKLFNKFLDKYIL